LDLVSFSLTGSRKMPSEMLGLAAEEEEEGNAMTFRWD
jgi:hypothetical protein